MENLTISALEQILSWPTASAVAVLSLIALIYVANKLLSSKDAMIKYRDGVIKDKDNTIEILRWKISDDRDKMFDFISKVSIHMEKMSDLNERHNSEAEKYREKILTAIDRVKDEFISLPCKSKWQ